MSQGEEDSWMEINRGKVTIVAGGQWGDEGKGRVVDLFAGNSDMVIRCQGGPNAGHTVINDQGKFVLHTVPSGIFNPNAICIIGAGTVINPIELVKELTGLIDRGIDITRLLISERAHLIMPYHRLMDKLDEERLSGSKIGSTGHGIAWAYTDKAARRGYRAYDLLDLDALQQRLERELPWNNMQLSLYGHPGMTVDEIMSELAPCAVFLRQYIGDTVAVISKAISEGRIVTLEGQLGVMRDLDFGVYPFVTSSDPTPAGMCAGAGVSPIHIGRIVGVVKAYTSAVGSGPFPTELIGPEGDALRKIGDEYGATTGRPRRCGWFDVVAVKWAGQVAGFTEMVITKIDILDGREELPICVGYTLNGKEVDSFPMTAEMGLVKPVYKIMSGWTEDTSGARSMSDLPLNAIKYINEIERLIEIPITQVSVGPERDAIIVRSPNI